MKRFLLTLALMLGMVAAPIAAEITHWDKNLFIVGLIQPGDYNKFIEIMNQYGDDIEDVWMDSPGGSFIDGLSIGTDIHILGLNTIISGQCYSSCAWIFLAGKTISYYRNAQDAPVVLGIHMPGQAGKTELEDLPDWILAKSEAYLDMLDLPQVAKDEILATPNSTILRIGRTKATEWGIWLERKIP